MIFKKIKVYYLFFILAIGGSFMAQGKSNNTLSEKPETQQSDSTEIYANPKLVVGIVVDQMRYDYITRFWDRYEEDGFKRLINQGYTMKNAHYNYVPTFTAPGHTSIWTGTSPRYHGVIGNSFFDKTTGKKVVPVQNDSVNPVGTDSKIGKRSPKKLLATTLGDQNRLATQFQGKTVGVALKDRASILPAGRSANGAYWFDGDKGHFITSTYYMDKLPQWVNKFNSSGKADEYLTTWETLYPIDTYTESGPDKNNFEGSLDGQTTFPYDLKKLAEDKYSYGVLTRTAYGNNLTTDFAIAAVKGEELGKDDITDILTVSYSSPDYIGHRFGVNSKEAQDNYLRLDQEIAKLLKELDEQVGKGNYTVFLTADHGAVNVPAYLQSKKIRAGYFNTSKMRKSLRKLTEDLYGIKGLIANISNRQIFFDYAKLEKQEIEINDIAEEIKNYLINYPEIAEVYTRAMIESSGFSGKIASRVKNGFNPKRSGDVVYELNPGFISYGKTGSQHGSAYSYDTHIPMIFYGNGINKGQTTKPAEIVDITPTIAALLGISFPNAATGQVLNEVIDTQE